MNLCLEEALFGLNRKTVRAFPQMANTKKLTTKEI